MKNKIDFFIFNAIVFMLILVFLFPIILPLTPLAYLKTEYTFHNGKDQLQKIAEESLLGEPEWEEMQRCLKENNIKYISTETEFVFFAVESKFLGDEGLIFTLNGERPHSEEKDITVIKKMNGNWYLCRVY